MIKLDSSKWEFLVLRGKAEITEFGLIDRHDSYYGGYCVLVDETQAGYDFLKSTTMGKLGICVKAEECLKKESKYICNRNVEHICDEYCFNDSCIEYCIPCLPEVKGEGKDIELEIKIREVICKVCQIRGGKCMKWCICSDVEKAVAELMKLFKEKGRDKLKGG